MYLVSQHTVNLSFAQTHCADLDELKILLNMENTLAIGEIGLDYSARNHGKTHISQLKNCAKFHSVSRTSFIQNICMNDILRMSQTSD